MNHLFIPKPSRSAAPPDASLSHALAHSPPPPAPPPKADSNAPGPRPPVRVPITTSDPFVEFIAKGQPSLQRRFILYIIDVCLADRRPLVVDWDEGDEFAMHLERKADDKLARKNKKRADKGQPSLAPDDVTAIDRLWDDKWDGDDVSDEFSQRLR